MEELCLTYKRRTGSRIDERLLNPITRQEIRESIQDGLRFKGAEVLVLKNHGDVPEGNQVDFDKLGKYRVEFAVDSVTFNIDLWIIRTEDSRPYLETTAGFNKIIERFNDMDSRLKRVEKPEPKPDSYTVKMLRRVIIYIQNNGYSKVKAREFVNDLVEDVIAEESKS